LKVTNKIQEALVSKHEGEYQPTEVPPIPESLRRRLEQQAQPETPVYRVGQDGTGRLEKPTNGVAMPHDPGGDLMPLLMGIQQLAEDLWKSVDSIPDIVDGDGKMRAERLDLSTRLAIVHAGNAIDYASRRVEDIARSARIVKLRSDLAHEMRRAGLEGDPATGVTES
jgi:hypothetical protein